MSTKKKSSMVKIGVLWQHKDKNNVGFLSGTVDLNLLHELLEQRVDTAEEGETMTVFIFKNKYRDLEKDKEKRKSIPQWLLYFTEPEGSVRDDDDNPPF